MNRILRIGSKQLSQAIRMFPRKTKTTRGWGKEQNVMLPMRYLIYNHRLLANPSITRMLSSTSSILMLNNVLALTEFDTGLPEELGDVDDDDS